MGQGEVKPALLTRSEVAFLRGLLKPNPNLSRVLRHNILQKVRTFTNLELPLLKEASKTWSALEEALKPIVNAGINGVNTGINAEKNEPKPLAPFAAHEVLAGPRGLEPLTPSSAGWCPIQARRRPHACR